MSEYPKELIDAVTSALVSRLPDSCGLFWSEAETMAIAALKAANVPLPLPTLKFGDKVKVAGVSDLALVLDADSEDDEVLCAFVDGISEWVGIRDLDLIDAEP